MEESLYTAPHGKVSSALPHVVSSGIMMIPVYIEKLVHVSHYACSNVALAFSLKNNVVCQFI
jgi:hypothetical protein